jgi:glycerate 2-kinase
MTVQCGPPAARAAGAQRRYNALVDASGADLRCLRADARALFASALAAVAPGPLVARHLWREGDALVLSESGRVIARHAGPVLVVGAGKAGLGMARAAVAAVGEACVGGLVIVPHGAEGACGDGVEVVGAAHPVPDAAGEAATARLLAMVARVTRDTLVLVVLSGGGSALLVAPAPGIGLADKQALTAALLAAGADIGAVNAMRKHCSRVKGGGLVRAAAGAAGVWAVVLSDVVGDDLATIASGPTAPDPGTFAEAVRVLDEWLARDAVPAALRAHLARGVAGEIPDTPKPGDALFARVRNVLVGGNPDAVRAAAEAAAARGYATEVADAPLAGDAAAAGRALAARLLAAPRERAVALIAGGETTVRVAPGGRGGRSQQLALAAAVALAGAPAVLLAAGTDGVDGPTDAAGACVDGETTARARAAGFDPAVALAATDSHPLLAATSDLVRTGPTGTNVTDVVVALRAAW